MVWSNGSTPALLKWFIWSSHLPCSNTLFFTPCDTGKETKAYTGDKFAYCHTELQVRPSSHNPLVKSLSYFDPSPESFLWWSHSSMKGHEPSVWGHPAEAGPLPQDVRWICQKLWSGCGAGECLDPAFTTVQRHRPQHSGRALPWPQGQSTSLVFSHGENWYQCGICLDVLLMLWFLK